MRKIIIVGVIAFVVGAIISPVAGMAISSTRSLILGMAPDEAILVLADKIDEESGRNDEQEKKLIELNNATTQQDEEMAILKNNQKIVSCEQKKKECEDKIYELKNGELNIYRSGHLVKGDRLQIIKDFESSISNWKEGIEWENKQKNPYKPQIKQFQDNIKEYENNIMQVRQIMANEQKQIEELIDGECTDYQNPCE